MTKEDYKYNEQSSVRVEDMPIPTSKNDVLQIPNNKITTCKYIEGWNFFYLDCPN
jgi:hypothetical protein